jgi:DNA-binding transcriptional LysR family regulator
LTISVAPSVASKWLLPRLSDFTDRYPDIDLKVSATDALAESKRDKVDLAIRLGRGSYPDLHAESSLPNAARGSVSPNLRCKPQSTARVWFGSDNYRWTNALRRKSYGSKNKTTHTTEPANVRTFMTR